MGNVRLGHNTEQHRKEPDMRADSVGAMWSNPVELQNPLVCSGAGIVTSWARHDHGTLTLMGTRTENWSCWEAKGLP